MHLMLQTRWALWTALLLLCTMTGCGKQSDPPKAHPDAAAEGPGVAGASPDTLPGGAIDYRPASPNWDDPRVDPPTGPLLYQPMLVWEGGEPSYQGTGFVAVMPDGRKAGVTSAHFVDFTRPGLLEMQWLSVVGSETRATFTDSVGEPGRSGTFGEAFFDADLRSDYLILAADPALDLPALELDTRNRIEMYEPVWFPNKARAGEGYGLLEGDVNMSGRDRIIVVVEQDIRPQSQSGSPVISQRTGKVIGILVSATYFEPDDDFPNGHTYIFLTPAREIYQAMQTDERIPLRTVRREP